MLLLLAAIAVYLILDMDVEKADYSKSLKSEISSAQQLLADEKSNQGNEEGQYAPYTLLAFQKQIEAAEAVSKAEDSEYNDKKDAYETLKGQAADFKKAENRAVVSKDRAAELAQTKKTEEFTVELKEGREMTCRIDGADIKTPSVMNLTAREEGPYYREISEILSELSLQGSVVSFYQDGSFGGKITVEIPHYSEKKTAGYAYKVDVEDGKLQFISEADIDTDQQTAVFSVSEGGDYVVLTKKLHKDEKKKTVNIKEAEKEAEKEKESGSSGTGGADSGSSPSAKPEPEEISVTIEIRCDTLAQDLSKLEDPALTAYVPADGTILRTTKVKVKEGTTVFDVLNRVCRDKNIQVESSYTPAYGSYYVEGINYLYEFDGGNLSGWMYKVNGWFPNYGCSEYTLKDGDQIVWVYTCDLGNDVGGGME